MQLEMEVIERARQAGDRRSEANAQMNLGYQYALLGLYKQARSELEQALRMAQAIGDRTVYAYCLQDLGYVYWHSGDGRKARGLEEQALRESSTVGDAFGRAAALDYLGFIEEAAGDYVLAIARLEGARQEFNRLGVTASGIEALAVQARCTLAVGQLDDARQLAEQAWAYLREHGPKGIESPSRAYVSIADIFDALGATKESRAAIESGYVELESRANKISNAEWRRSFLENVEEHRALVEMWERL